MHNLIRTILLVVGALVAGVLCLSVSTQPAQGASPVIPNVGIWYSTWYAKTQPIQTTWLTGFGAGTTNQFVGDVNGDGLADAVTFSSNGTWQVALSNGVSFSAPTVWTTGHGAGSTEQFLADVNGDGKLDALVYFNSDVNGDGYAGDWYVALSTGTGFAPYSLFKSGAGYNADKHLLADINGDGKADIVSYFGSTASWSAALSTGSTAGPISTWAMGFGSGTSNQFLADANGDGKADAITFDGSSGNWYLALSSGSGFGASTAWTSGHGAGSSSQFVSDGNGDGYAEPYVFFNADIGFPTGDGQPGDLVGREYDRASEAITSENAVFNSGFGYNSTKYFQANVTGDKYGFKASVAFYAGTGGGTWQVQRYHANKANIYDTWAGFSPSHPLLYRPYTMGSYQTYDSGDSAVIDEHIATLSSAKIDYLLLDETNHLNVDSGYILDRARDVTKRLAVHNAQPGSRQLKYAFAIGAIQFSHAPVDLEQEAAQTWAEFASDPTIGSSYFTQNGKPLLVVDGNASDQTAWQNYTGDKTASSHFTVQWADYPAKAGQYGWELPATGTIDNDNAMVVMPGWNNNAGSTPVSRRSGLYYIQNCLDPILTRATRPANVIINSFNEFAEETAVQVSDTSQVVSPTEKWINTDGTVDNAMYWNLTQNFVEQLKQPASSHRASTDFSSVQNTNGWDYEQWSAGSVAAMTWDATNSRWRGTVPFALIGSNWQHPDVGADSVRVYTAPTSGSVTLTGTVTKQDPGGDGVVVRILKNGTQIWPAGTTGKTLTDTSSYSFYVPTTVSSGDKVQFLVDSGPTADYDTTLWDPTLTYQ